MWDGGLKFTYIGTNNVSEDELNSKLEYTIVTLDNWNSTCTREVIADRRLWRTTCSNESTVLVW